MNDRLDVHPSQIPFVDLASKAKTSFLIKPIEKNIDRVNDEESSHRHNFQEILWIHSGSGTHSIDDQILEILPHTFYLVAQGQVHKFIEGFNLSGQIIQFGNDFLLDLTADWSWASQAFLINRVGIENVISIAPSDVKDFEILMGQIRKEYGGSSRLGKNQVLRYLLNILLIKLQRNLKDQFERNSLYSDRYGILQSFLELLDQHFMEKHQVGQYIDELAVSSRQLTDITKSILGKTPKEMIRERLMLEAKRHLNFSGLSVKEIAYALGFDDPSYFSKQFKWLTSLSPLDYRRKVRQGR